MTRQWRQVWEAVFSGIRTCYREWEEFNSALESARWIDDFVQGHGVYLTQNWTVTRRRISVVLIENISNPNRILRILDTSSKEEYYFIYFVNVQSNKKLEPIKLITDLVIFHYFQVLEILSATLNLNIKSNSGPFAIYLFPRRPKKVFVNNLLEVKAVRI